MRSPHLPHGSGFSFVDAFEIVEPAKKLFARKYLDPAWPIFLDHFPKRPIFPTVLLIEAAAQAAGVLWGEIHLAKAKPYALAQVTQFKTMQSALPGDILEIHVCLEKDFDTLAQFKAEIFVDNHPIASGQLVLACGVFEK